ncbi:SLBB domain-containing protein [SAR86 cluster bacterium]|nr:SLBB domain-containing protein [SAR86 cluster bacterium]
MIKQYSKIYILFLFSFSVNAQDVSQYQTELDMLPDSVRNSVFERMSETDFPEENTPPSTEEIFTDNRLDRYDLLNSDYDRYGSLIPKPFGYDLFRNYQRTSSSSSQSAPADYVLGPGDQLRINFSGSTKASRKVVIDREGSFYLREIGSINLSGLSYKSAQEELDRIVEASLIGTEVSISLLKVRPIQIFVAGQSINPGSYNLSALSNISSALFESGGPNNSGSLRNISLKRSNEVVGTLDLYDLFISGNSTSNIKIQSGDVLLINPIQKQIKIFGEVNREAIFELTDEEGFKDLLFFASGLKPLADKNKIVLTRQSIDNSIFIKEMTLSELKGYPLEAGDSIFIDRLPSIAIDANKSKRESIKLEGAFVNPGKYFIEEGETLFELITRSGGYSEDAYVEAGILLRNSVAKREKDGLVRAANDLEKGIARAIQTGQFSQVSSPDLAIRLIGNIVEQLKDASPLGRVVTNFDLSVMNDKNLDINIVLRDSDRIIMPKKKSTITVSGEVLSPSSYVFSKNLSYSDYIKLAGGFREGADKDNVFFLLPNGQASKAPTGWFSSNSLLPGTVIVVPQDTTELSNLAFWRAILPIFSNLVQTLAAIDALSD